MWCSMQEFLAEAGEVFGAGLFEERNASWARRFGRALRRYLDAAPLPAADGTICYYPSGAVAMWRTIPEQAIQFHYSAGIAIDFALLERKLTTARDREPVVVDQLFQELRSVARQAIPGRFSVGGNAYTHSIPDFETLVKSGIDGIRERWNAGRAHAEPDWSDAMNEVIAALERYVARAARHLRDSGAPEALCRVFESEVKTGAKGFFGALALFNFFWYLDDGDSIGRFDGWMRRYYEADPVSDAQALAWLEELWHNVDLNNGWHMTVGGHSAPERLEYSHFTLLVLRSLGKYRRPNAGLLVDPAMPEACWEAVFDNLANGSVNPALYNEAGYFRRLQELTRVAEADLYRLAYGGCTELMFSGCSNVGSIDAGLNVLEILSHTVESALPEAPDFAAFEQRFRADLERQLELLFTALDQSQQDMALYRPHLVRSMLIGDCLERGRDFNDGGARCNGSVINFAGLTNTYNALWTIRECFAGRLPFDRAQLRTMLKQDYHGFDAERKAIENLPKFGNGFEPLDRLAGELTEFLFCRVNARRIRRGDGYAVASVILFVTYADLGAQVGPTADGRRGGTPLADSVGAMQGTDLAGPTALLRSCAALPQDAGIGTLVLNLRLDRELVTSPEGRARLKALIQAYFAGGGLQVQISMADSALLEAALANPDDYPQLMVRIGGYSEYFRNLPDDLKREVIKRTIQK